MNLRRIRNFASILSTHLPKSSSPSPSSSSAGGLAFHFTPDSSKLVMSTATTACILVIDLSSDEPQVLRRFDHHRLPQGVVRERVVKGRTTHGDVDLEDATTELDKTNEEDDFSSSPVNILRISISPDGQWLVSSDDHSRTHVFNLDSIQVRPCSRTADGCSNGFP